jgi:hypothetical protein
MRGGKEPEHIEAEFVEAAVRLWREYFWPHSRAALRQVGLSDRHANARRVLRFIRARGLKEISVKDVRRDALGERLDAEQTEGLLDGLTKACWLRKIPGAVGGKGGRPAHRWWVSPFLYEGAETAGTAETGGARDVSTVSAVPAVTFRNSDALPHGMNEAGYVGTAAPDPNNRNHTIALKALENDVLLKMAPATWWVERVWAQELKKIPPTAPGLAPVTATGTFG